MLAGLIVMVTTLGAPVGVPPADAPNIALSTSVVSRVGDQLWSRWSQTPFVINLLTEQGSVMINGPSTTPRPVFLPNVQATTYIGGIPTIVIGEPQFVHAATPARWSVTLLHEHFHQWQDAWPDYHRAVESLGLAHGDVTGRWMVSYPFAYAEPRVNAAYRTMANALADALGVHESGRIRSAITAYLHARDAFKTTLRADDYRYFAFQCWQEGAARYTEIAVARAAAKVHATDPKFLSDEDARALSDDAEAMFAHTVYRLRTAALSQDRRLAFYGVGAGEALLLDVVAPGWQMRYLSPELDLSRFFELALPG